MADYSKQKKHTDIISKYISKFPTESSTKLAELIEKEQELGLTIGHLRQIISAIRRKPINDDINQIEDEIILEKKEVLNNEPYIVEDGFYKLSGKNGEIKISIEQADQLFYEYSKHGLNLSQQSIRHKHGLSIWDWHSIKRSLWLYKDSDIFSPWSFDNMNPEELKQKVNEKLNFKEQDKRRLVATEHDKVLRKHYNNAINELNKKAYSYNTIIDHISEWLPTTTISTIKRTEIVNKNSPNHIIVSLADIHIGAEVKDLRMTPNFNIDIARKYLDKTATIINSIGAKNVHLAFLGDLIESFTGLNHKDSWKSMAWGMYGSMIIKTAVELLEEFFGKINNLNTIYAVAGNHDRMSSSKDEDNTGEIAGVIFYMLQRIYGDTINIVYDPLTISTEIDNINYIFAHGDKRIISDPVRFIFDNGRPDLYNIIMVGHLHNRSVIHDNNKFRVIRCPSIFTGNFYSESNGWHSLAGFIVCQNSTMNVPIVTDYSLNL